MDLHELKFIITTIDNDANASYEELTSLEGRKFETIEAYTLKKERLIGEQFAYNNILEKLKRYETVLSSKNNKQFDVAKVFLLDTGNITVFNTKGVQIPELQARYSIEIHQRILFESNSNTIFEGFEILPVSFVKRVEAFVNHFKKQNLTWQQVQEYIVSQDLLNLIDSVDEMKKY